MISGGNKREEAQFEFFHYASPKTGKSVPQTEPENLQHTGKTLIKSNVSSRASESFILENLLEKRKSFQCLHMEL